MTDQEIARALEEMIREDGKRPPEEQLRDLIKAGVIDSKGRVLIGRSKNKTRVPEADALNGPGEAASRRKARPSD
jgi:hypothetical protein